MKYTPHKYQEYAKDWIIEKEKSGLLLDMGLGKSVITLTAIDDLMFDYFEIEKVLIIAPLRVAESTWDGEIEKWDHLKDLEISKVLGPEKKRIEALEAKADIYIINRENVKWLVDRFVKAWTFDMVVIDELSSFKSHRAGRFKSLKKVRPYMKRVLGLTGTPALNGLLDLWAQIYLLDGGQRLGRTITSYRERYFNPDKRNQHIIFTYKAKENAEEEIYEKLSDICIIMKSEDYLDMPDRINNKMEVNLPEKIKEKYKQVERDLLLQIENSDIVANTAGVLTNKLLQMADGAIYDENEDMQVIHDEKLKALDELIEAANGKPVLVFYSYTHDKGRIQKHLKDVRVLESKEEIGAWNKGKLQ